MAAEGRGEHQNSLLLLELSQENEEVKAEESQILRPFLNFLPVCVASRLPLGKASAVAGDVFFMFAPRSTSV